MSAILTAIRQRPVAAYFLLTFAISWGGLLTAVGPGGIPGTVEQVDTLLPMVVLALLAGPSVAGILLTVVVSGKTGLRELFSRSLRWRVDARWYAVAILTAPVLMLGLLRALSIFSPEFLPGISTSDDKASMLRFGVTVALGAGIFEELGWTGFAVPRLRQRLGILVTGLVVGLLWATWHVLPALWFSGTVSGAHALTSYMLDPFLFLVVFRVLMVWVYDSTGSVLLAMLMHSSLTASARILSPSALAGWPLVTFDIAWATLMVVVVATVAFANGWHRSRPPLRTRSA